MRRYEFELVKDAERHLATVVMESDSVTVSQKRAGNRLLGRPRRIPAALCTGGVEEQFQRSCLELKASGYVLMEKDDGDTPLGEKPIVFAVIQDEVAAMTWLQQLASTPIKPQGTISTRNVVELGSPNSAVMILLAQKGVVKLFDNDLGNSTPMDVAAIAKAAAHLPEDLYAAIVQQGFIEPGVVRSDESRMTAILF